MASSITDIITGIAQKLGVDPKLAVVVADQESGLNPQAVGDHGTSFGLYQLHEGGELGNLTEQQAFDPTTNATVALTQFSTVTKQNPGADPGAIAVLSQRPKGFYPGITAAQAAQTPYAKSVDAAYSSSGGLLPPVGSQTPVAAKQNPGGEGLFGQLEGLAGTGLEIATNPIGFAQQEAGTLASSLGSKGVAAFFSGLFPWLGLTGPQEFAVRGLEILGGAFLFALGLFALIAAASGKTGGDIFNAVKTGAISAIPK